MSVDASRSLSGSRIDRAVASTGPGRHVSFSVGRSRATVVVTVDGQLEGTGCELLDGILTDLIDGQGNLRVAIDLAKATVGPDAREVFIVAARRAQHRGGQLIVHDPPMGLGDALQHCTVRATAVPVVRVVPDIALGDDSFPPGVGS